MPPPVLEAPEDVLALIVEFVAVTLLASIPPNADPAVAEFVFPTTEEPVNVVAVESKTPFASPVPAAVFVFPLTFDPVMVTFKVSRVPLASPLPPAVFVFPVTVTAVMVRFKVSSVPSALPVPAVVWLPLTVPPVIVVARVSRVPSAFPEPVVESVLLLTVEFVSVVIPESRIPPLSLVPVAVAVFELTVVFVRTSAFVLLDPTRRVEAVLPVAALPVTVELAIVRSPLVSIAPPTPGFTFPPVRVRPLTVSVPLVVLVITRAPEVIWSTVLPFPTTLKLPVPL